MTNIVDVNVCCIRKKLGPNVIQTVRGVGYLMPTGVDYNPS